MSNNNYVKRVGEKIAAALINNYKKEDSSTLLNEKSSSKKKSTVEEFREEISSAESEITYIRKELIKLEKFLGKISKNATSNDLNEIIKTFKDIKHNGEFLVEIGKIGMSLDVETK